MKNGIGAGIAQGSLGEEQLFELAQCIIRVRDRMPDRSAVLVDLVVIAALLGYLFSILDKERARTTLAVLSPKKWISSKPSSTLR